MRNTLFTGGHVRRDGKKISDKINGFFNPSALPCLIALILFCTTDFSFAQTIRNIKGAPESRVSLSVGGGFWSGQSEEIVYQTSRSKIKLSQLLWDIDAVKEWGFSIDLSPNMPLNYSRFWGVFGINFGLDGNSGYMQDKDWAASQAKNPHIPYDGHMTNYSKHTNYVKESVSLDIIAGWNIPASGFSIKPYINFSYCYFNFIAKDGYKEYEKENWKHTEFHGIVCRFNQAFYSLSPALAFYFSTNSNFAFEPFLQAGYVFLYKSNDFHELRLDKFEDTADGGLKMDAGLKLIFLPFSKIGFNININYTYISLVRGQTKHHNSATGEIKTVPNVAGASLSLFNTGLVMVIRF